MNREQVEAELSSVEREMEALRKEHKKLKSIHTSLVGQKYIMVLPRELKAKLAKVANEQGIAMADVIRNYLERM